MCIRDRASMSRMDFIPARMPRSFAFLDAKLKKLVNGTISRGKTELALTVVNTVSYTHLDVYKRQQKVYVPKQSEKYYYMMYKPRGYITTTHDEREMCIRDRLDVVCVFVPPFVRKEYVLAAAKAGKQIVATKPLAAGLSDCLLYTSRCV